MVTVAFGSIVRTIIASFLLGGLLSVAVLDAADATPKWKRLLDFKLVDEWQAIFGTSFHHPARPTETWGQKLVEFNRVVAKSTGGEIIPIYLTSEVATTELPAINDTRSELGHGLELRDAPIRDVLRYVTDIAGLKMTVTDYGVLIDFAQKPANKAANR